jgi:hypothetical protein
MPVFALFARWLFSTCRLADARSRPCGIRHPYPHHRHLLISQRTRPLPSAGFSEARPHHPVAPLLVPPTAPGFALRGGRAALERRPRSGENANPDLRAASRTPHVTIRWSRPRSFAEPPFEKGCQRTVCRGFFAAQSANGYSNNHRGTLARSVRTHVVPAIRFLCPVKTMAVSPPVGGTCARGRGCPAREEPKER